MRSSRERRRSPRRQIFTTCAYGRRERCMKVLFWISVGLVFYTYGGYPLILIAMGSLRQVRSDLRFGLGRRTRRAGHEGAGLPRISIVCAAYNEAAVIGQKMRNFAALDYPIDAVEILIGCDG